jgi:voltage-gated potassium channel
MAQNSGCDTGQGHRPEGIFMVPGSETFTMSTVPDMLRTRRRVGQFSALFISIVVIFALRPFLDGFVSINILTDIFLSLTMLAAIHAVSETRSTFAIACALAFLYLFFEWAPYFGYFSDLRYISKIFGALYSVYITSLILLFIMRQTEITIEIIKAALCAYFLIGLMWSFVYLTIEVLLPGSFQFAPGTQPNHDQFIYFSFVTLTTVGYGDVTPISNGARSLAILEAVMGQFYLAVTVARLVSIHLAQHRQGVMRE